MWTDTEHEAPAARRLVAFGATFLGLLTLSNAAFVGEVPLLAPPLVAIIVILAAVAGVLVWVNTRYSRAALWNAAGFSLLAAAGSALVAQPPVWLAYVLIFLGLLAVVAAATVSAGLIRPKFAELAAKARWLVLLAGLLLALATAPVGPGPVLALIAAGALLSIAVLLHPAEPDHHD